MQYCLYLRKSRADLEAEARGEGETLKRHEQILLELAKKLNLNITKIYREIVSGETIAARPVMQQLLVDVEQGMWDGVLVMEIERLARGDTIDQGIVAQTFKYSNTKIITPMKTYDPQNEFDEEYFEFGLFMSRREYKTINRRLQNGRIASAKEGKYMGNIPPYGYIRKKLQNDKGYTLEPFPEQADIVRLIFELYTKGELQPDGTYKRLGTSLIARKLNDLHIPPAKADIWVTSSIQNILRNPIYVGKIRWNWRQTVKKMVDGQIEKTRPRKGANEYLLSDGIHEALVDKQTWNLAQEFLSNNPSKPAPKGGLTP
jgi:DNA invertase Pin-like site-specific DNA recombinase